MTTYTGFDARRESTETGDVCWITYTFSARVLDSDQRARGVPAGANSKSDAVQSYTTVHTVFTVVQKKKMSNRITSRVASLAS